MTVIGEAFVRVRPLATGFETEAKASVEKALGNVGGASSAAGKGLSEAEKEGANLEKRLGSLGQAASSLGGVGLPGVGKAAGGVSSELGGLSKAAGGLAGAMDPVTLAIGAAAVGLALEIGFLAKGVTAFEEQTKAVLTFQRIVGGTAQDDSRLVATLQALGVEPQQTARGFKILSTTIEQHQEKLTNLGIEVARNKAGQVDLSATLLNVGDAYKRTADPAERLQIVTTAFGRSGIALIPVLAQTRDRLQALNEEAAKEHLVFSQKDLAAGENLRIKTKQLSEEFKGLEIEAAHGLIPAVTAVATAFLKLLQVGDRVIGFLDKATQASKIFDAVGSVFGKVGRSLGLIDDSATKGAKAMEIQAQAAQADAAAQKELATAADAVAKASAKQVDDAFAVTSAQKAVRDANLAVADSADTIAKAQQDIVDKTDAIAKAQRDQATANKDVAKAQDTYNKLVAVGGADVTALADATNKLRDAQQSLADAQNNVLDAQDNLLNKQDELNSAVGLFGPKSREARDAQTALRDANVKLSDAQNHVIDANDAVAKAQKDQADATAGSEASQKRLADAADALATAQQKQADSADAVTKSQRDLTDAQKKLTDEQAKAPDVLEAQKEALFKLAQAQATQAEDMQRAQGATDAMIDSNALLKTSLGDLASTLAPDSPLRTFLNDAARQIYTVAQATAIAQGLSTNGSVGQFLNQLQGVNIGGGTVARAGGGPVNRGQFAVVGEDGPELVRFGVGGNVFNQQDTKALLNPDSVGPSNADLLGAIRAVAGGLATFTPDPTAGVKIVPVPVQAAPQTPPEMTRIADLLQQIVTELGRPNVSVGPITNAEVDPLHVASRIAFEFVPPSVAV